MSFIITLSRVMYRVGIDSVVLSHGHLHCDFIETLPQLSLAHSQ